jgi:hypothetical protein
MAGAFVLDGVTAQAVIASEAKQSLVAHDDEIASSAYGLPK